MPTRTSLIYEAMQQGTWTLLEIGREIKIARICSGRTQKVVAATVGCSPSRISRIERGKVRRAPLVELMAIAAAVGLKLWARCFQGGSRPLDGPQLGVLRSLNARLHSSWARDLEAVIPIAGDPRAVDELIRTDECSCAVEAITRFADVQKQVRSARRKQRDIGADRLILLVKASHANRRMLREAEPMIRESFPIGTRQALAALEAGKDPGGDCLILM